MADNNKQKLELTWIGKDDPIKPEPRVLLYDREKSYGDKNTENMLIHGDNLLALKALEEKYVGQIKCIYIDPPYNTGAAFEHYDDNLEHSEWLKLMRPRLDLLKNLLDADGSIWISIDDDEGHYLKVLCDEVFGRVNFVSTVIWEKKSSPQNDAKWLSDSHDFILVYAKNKNIWRPNKLNRTEDQNSIYKYCDDFDGVSSDGTLYGRGPWFPGDMTVKTINENALYEITTPSGRIVKPADGRAWVYNESRFNELVLDNRITFGKKGANKPCIKRFLSEIQENGIVPKTVWKYKEVGENRNARQEVKKLNPTSPFSTPKPERLLERILELATKEGDLVLDSFLGSGTTAAVAQKMGRHFIGVELREHCYTHCQSRLVQVIDGEQGGISKSQEWQGGGGFKFYELASSLIKTDAYGNKVIDDSIYNADLLAAAVAKINGYKYNPDKKVFWKQGSCSENSYIFTTTEFITPEYLDKLSADLGFSDIILVCCSAFESGLDGKYENIDLKKIPQSILDRCEYGKDNYNLNIIDTSEIEDEWEEDEVDDE